MTFHAEAAPPGWKVSFELDIQVQGLIAQVFQLNKDFTWLSGV
jgi:hypothetical protein